MTYVSQLLHPNLVHLSGKITFLIYNIGDLEGITCHKLKFQYYTCKWQMSSVLGQWAVCVEPVPWRIMIDGIRVRCYWMLEEWSPHLTLTRLDVDGWLSLRRHAPHSPSGPPTRGEEGVYKPGRHVGRAVSHE